MAYEEAFRRRYTNAGLRGGALEAATTLSSAFQPDIAMNDRNQIVITPRNGDGPAVTVSQREFADALSAVDAPTMRRAVWAMMPAPTAATALLTNGNLAENSPVRAELTDRVATYRRNLKEVVDLVSASATGNRLHAIQFNPAQADTPASIDISGFDMGTRSMSPQRFGEVLSSLDENARNVVITHCPQAALSAVLPHCTGDVRKAVQNRIDTKIEPPAPVLPGDELRLLVQNTADLIGGTMKQAGANGIPPTGGPTQTAGITPTATTLNL